METIVAVEAAGGASQSRVQLCPAHRGAFIRTVLEPGLHQEKAAPAIMRAGRETGSFNSLHAAGRGC